MSSVCRVCLVGNTLLHSIKNNMLLIIYEKLTNTKGTEGKSETVRVIKVMQGVACSILRKISSLLNKFNSDDARPRVLCSLCYQKLQRCHTFSQMAVRSEKIFNHVYDMGIEVTQDYITEVNLNMKQNMSIDTMPFITNDVNATNVGSQITSKDEPLPIDIDIKEEVIIEPDKLLEMESFPKDCANNQSTFKEISDWDNHTEELLSTTHIDQSKSNDSSFIIENESEFSIDIKEEITTELDKFVEIESFPEHRTKNLLTFEEDYSIAEKDLDKLLYSIDANKPDDSKMPISYSCKNCNEIFYMKSQLNSHIRYSHSKVKGKQNASTKKRYRKRAMYTKTKNVTCHLCDKTLRTKYFLNLHMRTHTDEKNASTKKHVEDKAIYNKNKKLTCPVCDETFDTKYFLNRHMRTHTDEQNASTKKHVEDKAIYNKNKKLTCPVCDETFDTKYFLNRHMRTHTDEQNASTKKHIEDKAIYKITTKKQVEDKAISNKKKKLACHLCDQTSDTKSHCHVSTDKKTFACNVCEKQFNHNSHLVKHLRTHTENIKAPAVLGPSAETQAAKMLIFLQNGEQRLITFTLPKESCTLQEVLEQVNVPFSEDTHIQCMQNTSSEVDYFVSVGQTTRIEEMLENHPMMMKSKSSPTFENFVKDCDKEEDVEKILCKNLIMKQNHDEKTKSDDPKMPFSCNSSNKIINTQRNFISTIRNSHAKAVEQQYPSNNKHNNIGTTSMTEDKTIQNEKKELVCLKQSVHKENIDGQNQRPSEQPAETDSGKMLVFLQNGEQRLITFTLPKKNLTLQEVLKQVNVPFSEDTHIQCMQNHSSGVIDYFVSVGSTTRIEEMLENHPMFVTEMGSRSTPSEMARPPSKVLSTSEKSSSDPVNVPEPPEQRSPPPRHVDGMLAVCKSCGYTGFDFSRCERCRRVFNEEPKGVPIAGEKLNNIIRNQKV